MESLLTNWSVEEIPENHLQTIRMRVIVNQ